MELKIAGIKKESVVDGPGVRYVIFSQGCKHNCKGCHNPDTHNFNGGYTIDADSVLNEILNARYIDGVTFSGGDPFYQAKEFAYLAKKLKKNNINILSYTGFVFENIIKDKDMKELVENIDILIDGPFVENKKSFKIPFRGSKNQRVINVRESLKENRIEEINF